MSGDPPQWLTRRAAGWASRWRALPEDEHERRLRCADRGLLLLTFALLGLSTWLAASGTPLGLAGAATAVGCALAAFYPTRYLEAEWPLDGKEGWLWSAIIVLMLAVPGTVAAAVHLDPRLGAAAGLLTCLSCLMLIGARFADPKGPVKRSLDELSRTTTDDARLAALIAELTEREAADGRPDDSAQ